MTIATWIASALLAALYLMAGGMKAFLPAARIPKQFPFVEDFGVGGVRVIGALELLGAVGVILPRLTGILPILAPIAATALVVVQVLAIIVHLRRKETQSLPFNVVLLLLAAFVAIAGFAGF